jgi:hypothetical protein
MQYIIRSINGDSINAISFYLPMEIFLKHFILKIFREIF